MWRSCHFLAKAVCFDYWLKLERQYSHTNQPMEDLCCCGWRSCDHSPSSSRPSNFSHSFSLSSSLQWLWSRHSGTLTSWTSLGPKVNGCDSQTVSREDPGKTCWQHIHTCTSFLSFYLSFLFLSLFTHGNAFRRWGKMSRGENKAPWWLYAAKSNKNRRKRRFERSRWGVQISALLQSHPFSAFWLRAQRFLSCITPIIEIQHNKRSIRNADGWWNRMKRCDCTKLPLRVLASTDKEFQTNSQ